MNSEIVQLEKKRLPLLWKAVGAGRSIDHLLDVVEPDEELRAICPGNVPAPDGSSATNYMIAATDRRLIVVRLGALGGAAAHCSTPYGELGSFEVERDKKNRAKLVVRGPEVDLRLEKLPDGQLADLERAVAQRRAA